jgi:DNA-binding transcriptional LysR family regulator
MALRRTLEEAFRRQGVPLGELQIVLETDSATVAGQAVADGLGIAFVPSSRAHKTRELSAVSLPGQQLEQTWFLVRQRSATANRAVDELWDFADSAAGRKLLVRLGLQAPTSPNAS